MTDNVRKEAAPGWVGGFAESNPAFAYPDPSLVSLPMLDNMANIDLLERQQGVKWPEFSWESVPGDAKSRCFQMFSPYISRIGYTDEGRVYSIICPQQGACSPSLGCMNVEITVTGQRGWVDETNRTLAADMTVEGTIWFSPSAQQSGLVKLLWRHFDKNGHEFPSSKAKAIKVATHKYDDADQPIFPVRKGESTIFDIPDFAKHPEAWTVGNVEVQIGQVKQTGDQIVDDFNKLVVDAFNMASGNMLKQGNLLTWNVYFTPPAPVNKLEWRTHAERWRKSIDADHGSPTGPGTDARYFDGSPFKPGKALAEEELDKILAFLKKHL